MVARVSATCFYWLPQFRRVRRSVDDDAIKTPVHAFITSRVNYCNAVLSPTYLSDYCIPVTAVSSRHLRSANQHQLTVPHCRRITFGHRAFSVTVPMVWNSLPTEFRDLSVGFGVFRRTLKTILFARYQCIQRNRYVCMILRYINFRYLSIYLSLSNDHDLPLLQPLH